MVESPGGSAHEPDRPERRWWSAAARAVRALLFGVRLILWLWLWSQEEGAGER